MRVAGEQLENPEVDLEDLRVDLWRSRTRGFNQGALLQMVAATWIQASTSR